ncbi:kisspeptin 2 [Eucyclogobius newberryi]|uniref:kisspeptin 2 n=1 Tax=Eucyclogobius newberryi TaxID=166745 RepID=UPI003B5A9410
MVLGGDVWLLTAIALGGLVPGRDGASMGVSLYGALGHGTQHNMAGAPLLRALRDVLPDDASVCVSETEERLLCTERSRFNHNTFGLRFGKRQGGSRHLRILRRPDSSYLPVPAYSPNLQPT